MWAGTSGGTTTKTAYRWRASPCGPRCRPPSTPRPPPSRPDAGTNRRSTIPVPSSLVPGVGAGDRGRRLVSSELEPEPHPSDRQEELGMSGIDLELNPKPADGGVEI